MMDVYVEYRIRKDSKMKKWLPLYDVFRNFKQSFEIDLTALKRFFEDPKSLSLCHNYF